MNTVSAVTLAYVRANNPSISDPGVCYSKCLPPLSINTGRCSELNPNSLEGLTGKGKLVWGAPEQTKHTFGGHWNVMRLCPFSVLTMVTGTKQLILPKHPPHRGTWSNALTLQNKRTRHSSARLNILHRVKSWSTVPGPKPPCSSWRFDQWANSPVQSAGSDLPKEAEAWDPPNLRSPFVKGVHRHRWKTYS